MNTLKVRVPNINCGHCVMTIKNELLELEGVQKVEGDPATKMIMIDFTDPATEETIKKLLSEINFPAE